VRHSKKEIEKGLEKWGKKMPGVSGMHVALDVSKTPPVVVLMPLKGAKAPLPGDPDQRPVNLRVRPPLEHFECVAGCGPFDSAVGTLKTNNRHHFRHKKAKDQERPGHDPESIWHNTAKHAFLAWMERQLRDRIAERHLDEHQVVTPQGTFEPDIYVVLDTGVRIAVEYQHSPGDPVVMNKKRRGYRAAGITDIWLYGPWDKTCHVKGTRSATTLEVIPNAAQLNMIKVGWEFHWFNPSTEEFGTPLNAAPRFINKDPGEDWVEDKPRTQKIYPQRPWRNATSVLVDLHPLDACTIDPQTGRLQSPADRRIEQQKAVAEVEIAQLKAAAKARYQERVAAEKAETERLTAERAAQEAREAAERAEAERLAEEKAEAERQAKAAAAEKARATAEREAAERAEAEPAAAKQLAEGLADEQARWERMTMWEEAAAAERADEDRRAAEQERLAAEQVVPEPGSPKSVNFWPDPDAPQTQFGRKSLRTAVLPPAGGASKQPGWWGRLLQKIGIR
jgi:Competence protein CoiA-like family